MVTERSLNGAFTFSQNGSGSSCVQDVRYDLTHYQLNYKKDQEILFSILGDTFAKSTDRDDLANPCEQLFMLKIKKKKSELMLNSSYT